MILMSFWFDLVIIRQQLFLGAQSPRHPAAIPACNFLLTRNKGHCWDGKIACSKHLVSISSWCCPGGEASQVSCELDWGTVAELTQGAATNPTADSVTELPCSLLLYGVNILQYAEMQSLALEAVWGPVEFGCIQSGWNPAPWDAHLFKCLPGMWREFVRLSQEPVSSCFRAGFISVARKNNLKVYSWG